MKCVRARRSIPASSLKRSAKVWQIFKRREEALVLLKVLKVVAFVLCGLSSAREGEVPGPEPEESPVPVNLERLNESLIIVVTMVVLLCVVEACSREGMKATEDVMVKVLWFRGAGERWILPSSFTRVADMAEEPGRVTRRSLSETDFTERTTESWLGRGGWMMDKRRRKSNAV